MRNNVINQLICAAVVDEKFCNVLLKSPEKALSKGYLSHHFDLSPDEIRFIKNIHADTIESFASKVATRNSYQTYRLQNQNSPSDTFSIKKRYQEPLLLKSIPQRILQLESIPVFIMDQI